jgi:hypothetical protein
MKNDNEALSEIIEKFVILSHIYDREFKNYILFTHNPLEIMFEGRFNKYSSQEVINLFHQIDKLYISELEKVFFDDLKRITYSSGSGRFWNIECKNN